jgi:hypothetical protein
MRLSVRARNALALVLCLVASISIAQSSGLLIRSVAAENTITVQLSIAAASTESLTANGKATVNLDNGNVKIEVHQATPFSLYVAALVSGGANIELGTFVVGSAGDGKVEGRLNSGTYVGIFQITKLGIIQFESTSVTFTIGASESASASTSAITSQSNQTTTTQPTGTSTANNSTQFEFNVAPSSQSVTAGAFAAFAINIIYSPSASIFLVARGVPPDSVAIFTPTSGNAAPNFQGKMTIVTSADTPSGNYSVSVVALVNGQEFTTQVTLQVSTSTSASVTFSVSPQLAISVATDQPEYQPGSTLTIQGHVTDSSGNAVAGASVSVQVDSATGGQLYFTNNTETDAAGTFKTQVNLSTNATIGTYTVVTSANSAGYSSAAARTTFIVGSSTTPSVVITAVYTGDSAGNPASTFSVGQTVWVWVVVQNIGATVQGVIWVQVIDPNGVPVDIRITVADLHAGETVTNGIGVTLSGNAAPGLYHVDALVSDKLISQGGTFLANAHAQFAIIG